MKIQAKFRNMAAAVKALDYIKTKGAEKAYLDAVDNFNEEFSDDISIPGTETGASLSSMMLGMGCYEESATPTHTRLVAEIPSELSDGISRILIDMGGIFD